MLVQNWLLVKLLYLWEQGLLDGQSIGTSLDDLEEYSELERLARSDQRSRRSFGRQKSGDDWDFPMDYLWVLGTLAVSSVFHVAKLLLGLYTIYHLSTM